MAGTEFSLDPHNVNHDNADIETITRRQLDEDIVAYRYDLNFSENMLIQPNLTPQETRTLQLRVLDIGHQIRRTQHRVELLQAQSAVGGSTTKRASVVPRKRTLDNHETIFVAQEPAQTGNGAQDLSYGDSVGGSSDFDTTTAVQRLGFWKCRLCTSQKYKQAGDSKLPAAPCKWPLKDIAKMMTHYLDLHSEHEPAERCKELGDALQKNRGPFEYWLSRTRAQKVGDGSIIDTAIAQLQGGTVPTLLKNLCRAAAEFPGVK